MSKNQCSILKETTITHLQKKILFFLAMFGNCIFVILGFKLLELFLNTNFELCFEEMESH